MDTVSANSRPVVKRRSLTLRLALPVGLAAAVAGIAFTAASGNPAAPAPGVATGSRSPVSISDVAYAVQSSGNDTVRLTILDPSTRVDVTRLQHDLNRLGVRSRVYAGMPGCHAPAPKPPQGGDSAAADAATNGGSQARLAYYGWDVSSAGTKQVLTIHPSRVPSDAQLFIYFPLAETSPANANREMQAGLMTYPAPACMPAKQYRNPLAGLWPTSKPTSAPATTH